VSAGGFVVLVDLLLGYAMMAILALLALRLFFPPSRFRFGTGSIWYRLGRSSDPVVLPIHNRLPPGTSSSVATVLAMVAVLVAGFLARSVLGGLFAFLHTIYRSLDAGSPKGALGYLLDGLVQLYILLVVIRILFAWFHVGYSGRGSLVRFVFESTEPALARVRGILPPLGMFDLSPILLFVALHFVRIVIRRIFLS